MVNTGLLQLSLYELEYNSQYLTWHDKSEFTGYGATWPELLPMPGLHLAHLTHTQAASMQLLHLNPILLPLLLKIRLDRFVVSENRLDRNICG